MAHQRGPRDRQKPWVLGLFFFRSSVQIGLLFMALAILASMHDYSLLWIATKALGVSLTLLLLFAVGIKFISEWQTLNTHRAGLDGAAIPKRLKTSFPPKFFKALEKSRIPLVLIVLTLIQWIPFGPVSGMPYETSLVNYSISQGILGGFYFVDPLRPFTSFSYHLGFLLSQNVPGWGYFWGLQLLLCLLLVLRVLVLFTLIKTLSGGSVLLAGVAATILAVFGADHATMWVGQMNQIAASTSLLAGLLLLTKAVMARASLDRLRLIGASSLLLYFALWSHEASIAVGLLFPLFFIFLHRRFASRRFSFFEVLIVSTPGLAYLCIYLSHLAYSLQSDPFRSSLLSLRVEPLDALVDFFSLTNHALNPFSWRVSSDVVSVQVAALGVSGILAAVIALRLIGAVERLRWTKLSGYFLWAAVFSAASLSPLILTEYANSLWRTHLLGAPFFSALIGGFLTLAATLAPEKLKKGTLVLLLVLTTAFGSLAVQTSAKTHWDQWQVHKSNISQVLDVVPCSEGSVAFIAILPEESRAFGGEVYFGFGHPMWFEEALKLAFPDTEVSGYFISESGEIHESRSLASIDVLHRIVVVDYRTEGSDRLKPLGDVLGSRLLEHATDVKTTFPPCQTPLVVSATYR